MTRNSFSFGNFNSLDDWGIKVIAHDFLMPPKRERKITIPDRDGAYDYGSEFYDERTLRLECEWVRRSKEIPRHVFREIAYHLSQKQSIRLWNEPDKYYIGELFDSAEITDFPLESSKEFELNFVCEPFAYGKQIIVPLATGNNSISYQGTAKTPVLIILRNTGSSPVQNIHITAILRE